MRMIVRVLLLLTHLFILFYKEGIHMINFNIPPFTGKETEYMTKAIFRSTISIWLLVFRSKKGEAYAKRALCIKQRLVFSPW